MSRQAWLLPARSVLGIAHPVGVDGKHGLGLWQAGRVVDFADPCLASAFPQVQSANTRPVFANLMQNKIDVAANAMNWHRDTRVHALLCPSVSSSHSPCGGSVRQNVASDGFLGICRKHGSPIHLCHHLVGYHHGDAELLRHGIDSC